MRIKKLFSTASMIEKLAFKRVSEEDVPGEVEKELALQKTASAEKCDCECKTGHKEEHCKCACHGEHKEEHKHEKKSTLREAFNSLLKVSETLDNAGFDKLAAASILLADKLIVEAKAKAKAKSEKSKSKKTNPFVKKDEKKSDTTKSDKKDEKKKSDKKDEKKSPSKSNTAKKSK